MLQRSIKQEDLSKRVVFPVLGARPSFGFRTPEALGTESLTSARRSCTKHILEKINTFHRKIVKSFCDEILSHIFLSTCYIKVITSSSFPTASLHF